MELMDGCGNKGVAGIFSYVRHSWYVHFSSRMNRLGTASRAGAFHRQSLYTSQKTWNTLLQIRRVQWRLSRIPTGALRTAMRRMDLGP